MLTGTGTADDLTMNCTQGRDDELGQKNTCKEFTKKKNQLGLMVKNQQETNITDPVIIMQDKKVKKREYKERIGLVQMKSMRNNGKL